ncbi:hypothetical protein TWF730_008959 [Orbilia blumenaviensis]|uniref:F-box domain-containing protein n=1 Tax=Orbilia blumenaviensis TaxID=1796055 RepID=A0AAV9UX48_9PEZI
MSSNFLMNFPLEIHYRIATFLPAADVAAWAITCRMFCMRLGTGNQYLWYRKIRIGILQHFSDIRENSPNANILHEADLYSLEQQQLPLHPPVSFTQLEWAKKVMSYWDVRQYLPFRNYWLQAGRVLSGNSVCHCSNCLLLVDLPLEDRGFASSVTEPTLPRLQFSTHLVYPTRTGCYTHRAPGETHRCYPHRAYYCRSCAAATPQLSSEEFRKWFPDLNSRGIPITDRERVEGAIRLSRARKLVELHIGPIDDATKWRSRFTSRLFDHFSFNISLSRSALHTLWLCMSVYLESFRQFSIVYAAPTVHVRLVLGESLWYGLTLPPQERQSLLDDPTWWGPNWTFERWICPRIGLLMADLCVTIFNQSGPILPAHSPPWQYEKAHEILTILLDGTNQSIIAFRQYMYSREAAPYTLQKWIWADSKEWPALSGNPRHDCSGRRLPDGCSRFYPPSDRLITFD